jgi:hypothetical protein
LPAPVCATAADRSYLFRRPELKPSRRQLAVSLGVELVRFDMSEYMGATPFRGLSARPRAMSVSIKAVF